MNVIVGADHGGYVYKEEIKSWLVGQGYEVTDVGTSDFNENDDFVDFAKAAVKENLNDEDRIILFCRNGFGMSIVANRFSRIRCGLAFDIEAVRKGRIDDDINCLSIPADYFDIENIKKMIEVFLSTEFSNDEKYKRRVMKIENLF